MQQKGSVFKKAFIILGIFRYFFYIAVVNLNVLNVDWL